MIITLKIHQLVNVFVIIDILILVELIYVDPAIIAGKNNLNFKFDFIFSLTCSGTNNN